MPEPSLRVVSGEGLAGVAERVLGRMDTVVATMAERIVSDIAEYAALPAGLLSGSVLPTSRQLVVSFFEAMRDGRDVRPRDLRELAESGRTRLDLGIPLDAVLHAYRVGGKVTWEVVCASVQPGEEALLATLAARWMDHVDRISSAVAKDYLQASHERLRSLDARRRSVLEAVLSARDPAEAAAVGVRHSTVLAPSYTPVLLCGTGAASRIDDLLSRCARGTLAGHRDAPGESRVLLLVPDGQLPPAPPGVLLAWGRATAPGTGLTEEVGHVEQTLEAALRRGVDAGSYGPEDLLVDQLLLAEPRVAHALARRVVIPLDEADPSGQLRETLQCWLATGNAAEVARRTVVHANTVGYRLARVRDVTGLDPRVPADAAVLVLALGGWQ